MSVPRPVVDARAREALDALEQPVSVATAVRDRDGRLLDFRLEHINAAGARWAGLPLGSIVGRLITDLIPALRPTGLFDALDRVVATGQPFVQRDVHYEGNVEEGRSFSARFELMAIRVGDGYLSAWAELPDDHSPGFDLAAIVERARQAVPVVRLEARSTRARLAARPAT
jgi:hypothetical protein